MKRKVIYSLAALSALPGAVNAADVNVSANTTAALAQTQEEGVLVENAVFSSTAGNKMVINVASSLMPGKYVLKGTATSENSLTVKYSVGGTEQTSTVADLASGITINVDKAS